MVSNLDKLTAVTFFDRPEGKMCVYTHTLLDANGNISKLNVKENFIVISESAESTVPDIELPTSADLLNAMKIVESYVKNNKLSQSLSNQT